MVSNPIEVGRKNYILNVLCLLIFCGFDSALAYLFSMNKCWKFVHDAWKSKDNQRAPVSESICNSFERGSLVSTEIKMF